ncbi:MAG: cysteine peptidase family C39 domain-containing protein [Sphingobacteriales bacterium]
MKIPVSIRRTFVKQLGPSDCGLACLQTILNLIGRESDANALYKQSLLCDKDLSLSDLKKIAAGMQLRTSCVKMQISTLQTMKYPCILHMKNDAGGYHFQVCYGIKRTRRGYHYLMADPARQVHWLAEQVLNVQWQSKAALHFEDIPGCPVCHLNSSWKILYDMRLFPKTLGVTIPLLNICSAGLGLALSWALQRGINGSFSGRAGLTTAVVVLLFVIALFKGLFLYVKQAILIAVNRSVYETLASRLVHSVVLNRSLAQGKLTGESIKRIIMQIHKIQQAVFLLMSGLLSDGALIILLLCGLLYFSPAAGLISVSYLIIMTIITVNHLPHLFFSHAHLNELAVCTESVMIETMRASLVPGPEDNSLSYFHRCSLSFTTYQECLRSAATALNNRNLLLDCLGWVNVISTLSLCLAEAGKATMAYSTLLILTFLSYIITALMPKLCQVLYFVCEGAEASRQFNRIILGLSR